MIIFHFLIAVRLKKIIIHKIILYFVVTPVHVYKYDLINELKIKCDKNLMLKQQKQLTQNNKLVCD